MTMNINDSSRIRECTSCQMCGAVCPVGAISISLNNDGFYRPHIDSEKCIDCGMCVRYCYKFDHEIRLTDTLKEKKLYSAWAKDEEIVESTTSGGIADLFVKSLIEAGYKCIGVEYDNKLNCAVSKIAATTEESASFRGSKYIQAYTVTSFKELVRAHKNTKFAVFGLPCQIYAIDRFLTTKGTRGNHLLIDFYCHGCPSLNLWKKYLDGIFTKTDCHKVISASFRSKVRGWGNFYVVVVVEGVKGRICYVSPRINDPFYTMFFSDRILNDACYDCKLRSTLEYTDVRLGDFWGNKFLNNHTGVSGVTICSEKGLNLFKDISHNIEYEEQEFSSFLPYQSYGKVYSYNEDSRRQLLSKLSNPDIGLKEIMSTYKGSLSPFNRIVLWLKNIMKLFPNNFISFIKSSIYSIKNK